MTYEKQMNHALYQQYRYRNKWEIIGIRGSQFPFFTDFSLSYGGVLMTVSMRGPGRRDTSYLPDLDETWSD